MADVVADNLTVNRALTQTDAGYDSSFAGKLGIGTTTPAKLLEVGITPGENNDLHDVVYISNRSYGYNGTAVVFGGATNTPIGRIGVQFQASGQAILSFGTYIGAAIGTRMVIDGDKIGIGTSAPTAHLALGGDTARTIQVERNSVDGSAGSALTVRAGGAKAGFSNRNGGDLYLASGIVTGKGSSNIYLQTAGGEYTGTDDTAPVTRLAILGNGTVGIDTSTPTATLGIAGDRVRTIRVERNTLDDTDGSNLHIEAGRPKEGTVNRKGGSLYLAAGAATGTGTSSIYLMTAGGGVSGAGDTAAVSRMAITGNGDVGIATTEPTAKLDVRGHVVLDPGVSPILYTGTGSAELNRYLQLKNSPDQPTASGLKAGGVLVSDTFGYANPGKNDLIVKGNVGIGIEVAGAKLDVRGHLILDPSISPILYTGTGGSELNRYLQLQNSPALQSASGLKAGGVLVSDAFDYANPGKNDLIVKGNVGIGIVAAGAKLDVRGHLILDPSTNPILYTGTGGAELNRYLQLQNSPAQPTPSGLKAGGVLVSDTFSYANPAKNDLIVKGDVGVGIANPAGRLHVDGNARVTGNLGIGPLSPTQKVHIVANNPGLAMYNQLDSLTTGLYRIVCGGMSMQLRQNNSPDGSFSSETKIMTWRSGGNVGIGTDTPSDKLEVAGGAVRVGGRVVIDSGGYALYG